jgi:flagellar biosynthesis component FlhA
VGFLKFLEGVRKRKEVAQKFMKDASCIRITLDRKFPRDGYVIDSIGGACIVDKLSIEIGHNLFSLVNKEKGAELMEGISNLRKTISFPRVHIIDNLRLKENGYRILVKGTEIFRGQCMSMPDFSRENAGIIVNKLKEVVETHAEALD